MLRWKHRLLLLAGYAVPYAALSMFADERWGSVLLYLLSVACIFLLCRMGLRTGNAPVCLIGSALSALSSLSLIPLVRTERWQWYFKPFSPEDLVIVLTVIAAAAQAICIFVYRKKHSLVKK